jgi:hypothetical protein
MPGGSGGKRGSRINELIEDHVCKHNHHSKNHTVLPAHLLKPMTEQVDITDHEQI